MPRLRYIEESEKTPHTRELVESAKRTGAPDPRVVSLMTRSKLGIAWVEYWNKLLYQGILPHKLKEMCRIKISVAHQCGYCSTVRSNVAKAEGLTESMISDLFDYTGSPQFSAREKAALHYADLFKQGEHAIDKDEVYAELAKHFSEEEIKRGACGRYFRQKLLISLQFKVAIGIPAATIEGHDDRTLFQERCHVHRHTFGVLQQDGRRGRRPSASRERRCRYAAVRCDVASRLSAPAVCA